MSAKLWSDTSMHLPNYGIFQPAIVCLPSSHSIDSNWDPCNTGVVCQILHSQLGEDVSIQCISTVSAPVTVHCLTTLSFTRYLKYIFQNKRKNSTQTTLNANYTICYNIHALVYSFAT